MSNVLQDYATAKKQKAQPSGNPLISFNNALGQMGSNVYNGIRNSTMGIDRFFGLPDNRMSPSTPQNSPVLGAINAVTSIPQDIGNVFNGKQQLISPLQNPLAKRPIEAQTSPTPQQTLSPTPTPTMVQGQGETPSFADFTTTPVPSKYAPLIYSSAKQAGVDPNVFASLLFSEHGFSDSPGYNYNTDGSYDRGIAQINNKAHPNITDQQALDPEFAIPYAASLLGHHIKYFNGDYKKGVAAYNVGEGGAQNPQTFNTAGEAYLNKIKQGLSPNLIQKLGL